MLDPVVLDGDAMDINLWPIPENEEWIIFKEEDHKSQHVFTSTEAMVGKPGSDMTFQFYVGWYETSSGGNPGSDGEVDFILRFHPASEIENIAYASTQMVDVGGVPVEFQMYALKDANGNDTNYIKLRDLASVLGQTQAGFEVGWNGAVNIDTTKTYTPSGSEMSTPFSGNRSYEVTKEATYVDGKPVDLDAFILKDDKGGAYTYYKLRDLGRTLGFNVGWSAARGIYVEPDKPYQE